MNTNDQDVFNALIDELAMAFPVDTRRIEGIKDIYFRYLSEIPMAQVRAAVEKTIRERDAFPTINQLRLLVGYFQAEHEKKYPTDEARVVWAYEEHKTKLIYDYEWVNHDVWTCDICKAWKEATRGK